LGEAEPLARRAWEEPMKPVLAVWCNWHVPANGVLFEQNGASVPALADFPGQPEALRCGPQILVLGGAQFVNWP
jgi:hypothetical protein